MSNVFEASVSVVSVMTQYAGAELIGDHASGVTELVVDNAFEFNEGTGTLLIDGDTLTYTGWDDETNTISLDAPTTSAYDDSTMIRLLPLSPVKIAEVVDIDGASFPAVVWHTLDAFLPDGIYHETGTILHTPNHDKVWLVNVPGRATGLDPGSIAYPSVTNRCTDPPPANYLNWVGGVGGGTGPSGYSVANDSAYSSQGLHAKITHGAGGWGGKIAPNGDGFTVDPYDPGGFGNSLGSAVRTYKITENMQFSFSYFSTADGGVVALTLFLYEADGTEISHSVSGAPYLSNWDEPVVPSTLSRFVTDIDYSSLLDAYPTLDSILIHVDITGGFSGGAFTWVGSCMVTDTGGLPGGSVVPYSPTSGVVYPNPPVSWDEILNRPTVFPPDIPAGSLVPAGGASGEVLTKDSGTDYDVSWQPSAGGGGGSTAPPVPVASQAAMLALTAAVGQVAWRSDIERTFMLKATPATTLGNWLLIAMTDVVAADVADFDTQVRTSRLDQMAAPTADVSMASHKLTNVTNPTSAQDADTKAARDAAIASALSGGAGAATDLGVAALINDNTTPSSTRAALNALYGFPASNPASKNVARINPSANGTNPTADGMTLTATGSASSPNIASTNIHTAAKRIRFLVNVAAANAVAGWRTTPAWIWRGDAARLGGFKAVVRFGPDTGQAVAGRMFTGLDTNVNAPTDEQPSGRTSALIGVGYDAADTQLYVMHNAAGGTVTKVATGLTRSSVSTEKVYTLTMYAAPNGSSVVVTIVDENANTSFTTTITTNLPSASTFLALRGWCSVGGVSSVIGYALMGAYVESDY